MNKLNQEAHEGIIDTFRRHVDRVPIKHLPAELRTVHDLHKVELKQIVAEQEKGRWVCNWLWARQHPEECSKGYVSDGLRLATSRHELQALYAYAWSEGMVEVLGKVSQRIGCKPKPAERLVLRQYLEAHAVRDWLDTERLPPIIREYRHHSKRVLGLLFKHHLHRVPCGDQANDLAEEFLNRKLTPAEMLRLDIYVLMGYFGDYYTYYFERVPISNKWKAEFLWQVFLRVRDELVEQLSRKPGNHDEEQLLEEAGDHLCRTWLRLREVGADTAVYLANRETVVPFLLSVCVKRMVWWAVDDLMEEYVAMGNSARDEFIAGLWQQCLLPRWRESHHLNAFAKSFQRTPEEVLPAFLALLESILKRTGGELSGYELDQVRSLLSDLEHYGCGEAVKKLDVDFSGVRFYGALG